MDVLERVIKAAKHEEPDKVPVVLQPYSMVFKRFRMMFEHDYYKDVRVQLESKIMFQLRFPEVFLVPMSVLPEGGETLAVPIVFGAKVRWMEDSPPFIEEYSIKTPEDIDKIVSAGVPDVYKEGIGPIYFEQLRYFSDWFPKYLRDKYGYIDGNIFAPELSRVALTMGYDKYFVWMRLYPDAIHKILKLATEYIKRFCEAQEEIVGKCKFLWMADHGASMVGKKQFNEFILPYLNEIFKNYTNAVRIWHNEGKCTHLLEEIDKIDAEVWHFGPNDDPSICKEKTHFCLQGNLNSTGVMLYGTPKEVEEAAKNVILKAGRGGGLWLSTGGGLAPNTPFKNIDALLTACDKFGKYPLKVIE